MTRMATTSKPKSPARLKVSVTPPRKSPEPSSEPFLRFYHSVELRRKTLSVLDDVEQADDATAHRDALAGVLVELMNTGMDYYFMKPLKRADAGFIIEQSAKLGLAATQQVMGSVICNIVGRMDSPQLLSLCASIRQLML